MAANSPNFSPVPAPLDQKEMGRYIENELRRVAASLDYLDDAHVGGKRTDTNATAFTLHDYHEQRIANVRTDFGATGDGTADDSTKFANADSAGKLIFIPKTANGYQLTSAVTTDASAWFPDPTLTWAQLTDSGQLDMTRGFYTTSDADGANIWRFSDRVFVGAAADQFAGDALSGTDGGTSFFSSSVNAQQYVARDAQLMSINHRGTIGVAGLSRSSDQSGAATACIGVAGAVVNDKASASAWGLIAEIQRESGAGFTTGLEVAAKNKGDNLTLTPYTRVSGVTGVWLAAGGDATIGGSSTNPSACAIAVVANDNTWNRGIVFEDDSITGTDGVTGTGIAIQLARGHIIQWLGPAGIPGANIRSDVDAASSNVAQLFDDNAVNFSGTTGKRFFQARYATNGVNFIDAISAATGAAPVLSAQGDDTNIDLKFSAKGTGVIQFGTHSALAAETVTGYITIKDSGGTTRKLAVVS